MIKKVRERDIGEEKRVSPKGDFALGRKHMSLALGGKKDAGVWAGGHPFDVELSSLPPGKKNYPLHAHAAQWEHFIILAGRGRMLGDAGYEEEIEAGDHIICPPGSAHLIENTGEKDLSYYVIADHHPADVTTYLRTGKRQIKPEYRVVELREVDYYMGEE